jgi:hypothetical protein
MSESFPVPTPGPQLAPEHAHNALAAAVDMYSAILRDGERTKRLLTMQVQQLQQEVARLRDELARLRGEPATGVQEKVR